MSCCRLRDPGDRKTEANPQQQPEAARDDDDPVDGVAGDQPPQRQTGHDGHQTDTGECLVERPKDRSADQRRRRARPDAATVVKG